MSVQTKKYFEDNPNAGKEHGERMKKYYEENPEARQKQSEITTTYFKDNPDARKENSEKMKKYYEDNPTARQTLLDKKGKNKPFNVFTTNGIFIKTFTYQFEATEYLQKEYHITSSIHISKVLLGHLKSSAGFVFKYK